VFLLIGKDQKIRFNPLINSHLVKDGPQLASILKTLYCSGSLFSF
jgi:hypothetical protein